MTGYGNLIRQIRKDRGWSQQELADRISAPQTSISKWEKSTYPPLDFIESSISVLSPGTTLSDFFSDGKNSIPLEYQQLMKEFMKLDEHTRIQLLDLFIKQIQLCTNNHAGN